MKLVETPHALPGSCKACGSGSKPPYIDTETSEEFHGAVYYCHECAGQIAQLLGFLSPTQSEVLIKENVDLAQQNFNFRIRIENLEKAIDGLVRSGSFDASTSVVASDDSAPSLFDEMDRSEDDTTGSGIQGAEEVLGNREGEVTEPLDDSGVAELHSDDESDASFRLSI